MQHELKIVSLLVAICETARRMSGPRGAATSIVSAKSPSDSIARTSVHASHVPVGPDFAKDTPVLDWLRESELNSRFHFSIEVILSWASANRGQATCRAGLSNTNFARAAPAVSFAAESM